MFNDVSTIFLHRSCQNLQRLSKCQPSPRHHHSSRHGAQQKSSQYGSLIALTQKWCPSALISQVPRPRIPSDFNLQTTSSMIWRQSSAVVLPCYAGVLLGCLFFQSVLIFYWMLHVTPAEPKHELIEEVPKTDQQARPGERSRKRRDMSYQKKRSC